MNNVDESLLQAILTLNGNQFFNEFIKWIDDSKVNQNTVLISPGTKDELTIRLQGSVFELNEIIDTVKNARKAYDVIQEGKKNRRPNL